MNTVTIGVSSVEDMQRRTAAAFRGKPQGEWITFASAELLWKIMTPRRWELVRAAAGKGPMFQRAAARLVKRDVKNIHADVQALLKYGVLEKSEGGNIAFPYDAVRVDFMIEAAVAVAALARISHRIRCIGAPNQRKSSCQQSFSWNGGFPRCRQSVAQSCSPLHL